MRTKHNTTDAALAMLGRESNTITTTAQTLGIAPAAMLAAAWRVLERQSTDAQPWARLVEGWSDEASATRQDVILAAVRLDAQQRMTN
jgi:predicted dinucleotide-binding enzyme